MAEFKPEMTVKDLPGVSVDKNPPANAGDACLIPGQGRFRRPRNI